MEEFVNLCLAITAGLALIFFIIAVEKDFVDWALRAAYINGSIAFMIAFMKWFNSISKKREEKRMRGVR